MSKYREGLAPNSPIDNTPQVGAIIDRINYNGSVDFIISAGTLTTAAATFTPKIEHGDAADLSDAQVVNTPARGLKGTIAAATFNGTKSNTAYVISYAGIKRYCRLTITPAGNLGAAALTAAVYIGKPIYSLGTQATEP